MYLYTEEVYAEYRAWVKENKRWEPEQYWDVKKAQEKLPREQRTELEPWMFGFCDWYHDGDGRYNVNLLPPDPDVVAARKAMREAPDYVPLVDEDAVPLEKQHYFYPGRDFLEESWDRHQCRHGCSWQVDQAVIRQFWREYDNWN